MLLRGVSTIKMKKILIRLWNFLFPKKCLGCGRLGQYFCLRCRKTLKKVPFAVCPICERRSAGGFTHSLCQTKYNLDGLFSFFAYDGLSAKAIKRSKYPHKFGFEILRDLGNLADFSEIKKYLTGQEIIVPVPLHWWREWFRGFNQADIWGEFVAKKLGLNFHHDVLIRQKLTLPQAGLKMKERKKNVQGLFALNPRRKYALKKFLANRTVILVDDVWTSGATLRAAGCVLKRAGAKKVFALTLCRRI